MPTPRQYFRAPLPAGTRFGRLVVIEPRPRYSYWCRCDCGKELSVTKSNLLIGNTASCGCLHRELARIVNTSHGLSDTSEYHIWNCIKARCFNPRNPAYKNYGGRGISMCLEWRNSFQAFLKDTGPRPRGKTLDRINNDGNYEPRNCRWATPLTQARNSRKVHLLTARGASLPISAWSERVGLKQHTILCRIRRGWDTDSALFSPLGSSARAS